MHDVFARRLRHLDEVLSILEQLSRTPLDVFLSNPEKYGSAERFLQIAIEVLDDLGAHLVSRRDAGPVDRYRDIPDRLEANDLISEAEARLWRNAIGFRNILVHNYLDVDRLVVYEILTTRLEDLRSLMRTVVRAEEQA